MEFEIERFLERPEPQLRFYGAAARSRGCPFARIREFTESTNFYLAEVELPQVPFCYDDVEWAVYDDGEVTIEGKLTPASLFSNFPIGKSRKKIKLFPNDEWSMSFHFPGPVEWWTSDVLFTSRFVMEISVMKTRPLPVQPNLPFPPFVPFPPIVPPMPVVQDPQVVPPLPLAPVAAANPAAVGSVTDQSEIDKMIDEWFA